jgi:hypothetical protein
MDRDQSLYVTADWSRFVDEGSVEARFGVAPVDIDRLGLREAYEQFVKAQRRPADKMLRRPSDKATANATVKGT